MPEQKKFLIIDANAVLHRAFHALPPLKTKKGEIVNAVYGFCLVFLKAIKDIEPSYMAACFDVKGPTFRHRKFAGYKAGRKKAPDELYRQIKGIKKVLAAFSVPVLQKRGFEADDLIGSVVRQEKSGLEKIILTGDADLLQLTDEQTKVYLMRRGLKDAALYSPKEVKEKYQGLLPEQLVDFKALRGDPSDNIPGVKGVGEKTALGLINQFGSLKELYRQIEKETDKAKKIKQPVLSKLKQDKKQAFLSQDLGRIKTDLKLDFQLKQAFFNKEFKKEAKQVFEEFEFKALLRQITKEAIKEAPDSQKPLFEKQAGRDEKILQEVNRLESQGILSKKLAKVERELAGVVKQMEKNGVKIDIKALNSFSALLSDKLTGLRAKVFRLTKTKFNLNSTQQLSEVLFNKLGLSSEGLRKTPCGAVSTGVRELKKLKGAHPAVGLILKYRELFKLKSGFVDSLPQFIDPKTGRIHPRFHQLGAETGRMSCSEPNLQNIPIKGEAGRKIRQFFVPEKGFQFASFDYSQMELRVAACLSQDKKMIEAFKKGEDIHTLTASEVFNISQDKVSAKQRNLAKALNFGVLYGMGPLAFAERTGLARQDAAQFIEDYFKKFQQLHRYIESIKIKAKKDKFSATFFGRKRFLSEINSRDSRLRAHAERIAINMPMQGTSADIMKIAMTEIVKKGILGPNCRLLLQIHDELVFEIKKAEINYFSPLIKNVMEEAGSLKVPLVVEAKAGPSWGELSSF